MDTFEEILNRLPPGVSQDLSILPPSLVKDIEEIRLRCGQRINLRYGQNNKNLSRIVTKEDLQKTLNNLIKFSYYAYEDDIARGFITIGGGHRIGICGKAVTKNNQPVLIKEISSLNIRFAKEIKGCAASLIPILIIDEKPVNTLIVSPPGCGKTTLLRDIARSLSLRKIKVAICDERSEIAGMYDSRPSFDLGPCTDVLDGCDKIYGISILIRSMSPQVIITDEIGKQKDVTAIEQCQNAGIKLITSIHGLDESDLLSSPIGQLVKKGVFQNIVFLSSEKGPGTIREIKHA